MASQEQVRNFLAHWFQLGKPVVLAENRGECLPDPVFHDGQYSQSFEDCWHRIMVTSGRDCHLKGSSESIATMLLPAWDVIPCARCDMPLVMPIAGQPHYTCPCNDLMSWPNTEVPTPRTAVNNQEQLSNLHQRLGRAQGPQSAAPSGLYTDDEANTLSSWRGMS